ncbi:hypothetical protein L2E82_07700 [Cichorium intybus]|uniref:Uncharacterized protein n=1 Tax=Cichorium intybus TaxID=13427 RepID=A0ACB9G5S7_CICIN|nr:hypothetical protein L2E82_07700 [Cichorium intybus]
MPIDKSWTTNPKRKSPEFEQGLESFAKICQEHADSRGYVRCACQRCHNTKLLPMHLMKHHMRVFGFSRLYKTWCYHGETSDVDDVAPRNDTAVDDVAPRNDMIDVIEDVMEEVMEEDSNIDEGNLDTESIGVCDDFEDLLKEVQSELYPGCAKFSSLDFLAKLMHIKVNHKWTNSSFDELLELLQSSYPEGNKIPSSHYVAKKTLKKIGLGYESIHVCRNDCALFWKEYSSLQNCPVCNESRWINEKTNGKKIAHKVLRYFPVTPRLRRLYCSRHTAKDMIWHSIGRSEEGTMRHPVDGSSWKEFDQNYPNFSREPRNVRLGLAADGFNPYGNMSSVHSTWPVILTTYNLPPWLCMKETSFMLSLLIPGPKSPGKDMDVFLRPLVEELKQLWQTGVRTKDAATNTFFTMKAALLWTINDYPARSSLSGWSGQGYKACPTCNEDTPSVSVTNKIVYLGHRRFLAANHHLRKNLNFNGKQEMRPPPRQFSNADIKAQLDRLLFRKPGKHPEFGLKEPDRQDFELNWSKRSIFFELEYWSSLQLKHNLDVMHVEKNVCCSLLSTLLMNDKTKDTSNARSDLEKLNIRRPQWLRKRGKKFFRPQAKYSFTSKDRELFCQFVKDIKLPDGFGSNISSKVSDNNKNITALKSHDYHIIMQRLMPIGVRGFLNKDTYTPIVDLCMFFKQLCSRTLLVKDMKKAKNDVITILCKLELIYPPAFFDIMIHLVLHLPDEALCGGPVYMRWMYPFERYMKKLKNYVRNKARPEGCMAEGYVAEEALTFCSMYLRDVQTRFNRPDRNEDAVVEKSKFWGFESKCRPTSARRNKHLDPIEKQNIEWFVLDNYAAVREYMKEFESEHPGNDIKTNFPNWFLQKVYSMKTENSPEFHEELSALSMGVGINASTYTACIVNGVRFMVLGRDAQRRTQNSGVLAVGENGEKYYGQLEEIIEVQYTYEFSAVLFRCKWFDTRTENNITSINTEREIYKNEQLIFASQAKQVFFIREPSRRNQNNHPWWVVEEVNHRKIWDVHNGVPNDDIVLAENVDVVHNPSSSNCGIVIDLSQYFQNIPNYDTGDDSDTEVDPPTVTVNRVIDCEFDNADTDYDTESAYDTEVSEDGAGDPPLPPWRGAGLHEMDGVPARRKTRGKAKNLELQRHRDKTGQKFTLEFDRATTYTPVGRPYDLLVREVGIYMWNNMSFDRKDWNTVTRAEKDALVQHLKRNFDFDAIEDDCERMHLKGGVDAVLMKRYRDRKSDAKVKFDEAGGYNDIDRARAHPPRGRKKIEQFKKAHTRKDGTWDSDLAYQQYIELEREFELLNDPSPEPAKEVGVFEKVLGSRRGHYKGIGRKPPVTPTIPPHFDVGQPSQEAPTKDALAQMLEDPRHRDALAEFLRTYTTGHGSGTSKGAGDTQGDESDQDDQDDDLE